MSQPRCNRCNRILKDAESIAVGLGPTCFAKLTGKTLHRKSSTPSSTKSHYKSNYSERKRRPVSDGTISLDEWESMQEEEMQKNDESC